MNSEFHPVLRLIAVAISRFNILTILSSKKHPDKTQTSEDRAARFRNREYLTHIYENEEPSKRQKLFDAENITKLQACENGKIQNLQVCDSCMEVTDEKNKEINHL